MDREEITMLAEVRQDVKWLVDAHKSDKLQHKEFYERLGSLERSRSRVLGASAVGAALAAVSGVVYKIFGG